MLPVAARQRIEAGGERTSVAFDSGCVRPAAVLSFRLALSLVNQHGNDCEFPRAGRLLDRVGERQVHRILTGRGVGTALERRDLLHCAVCILLGVLDLSDPPNPQAPLAKPSYVGSNPIRASNGDQARGARWKVRSLASFCSSESSERRGKALEHRC